MEVHETKNLIRPEGRGVELRLNHYRIVVLWLADWASPNYYESESTRAYNCGRYGIEKTWVIK